MRGLIVFLFLSLTAFQAPLIAERVSYHTIISLLNPYFVNNDLGDFNYPDPAFDHSINETASYSECTEAPGGEPDSGGSKTRQDPYWETHFEGDTRLRSELIDFIEQPRNKIYDYNEIYSTWSCNRYVEGYKWREYETIEHNAPAIAFLPPALPFLVFDITETKGYVVYTNLTPHLGPTWTESLNTFERKNQAKLIERNVYMTKKYTGNDEIVISCNEAYAYSQDENGNTLVQVTRTTGNGIPWGARIEVQDSVPYDPDDYGDTFVEWCPVWDSLELLE